MDHARADAGLGLYVHWPFCEAKCPYCDFNSHVAASVDHDRWREALLMDLRTQARALPGRTLHSIFFGGGTPSRMMPETVAALIAEARALWPTVNDLEITLEANPTSVEAAKFAGFARAGVNRVSIGVQSLRDDALRVLGRTHDAAQARQALTVARDHFARVSFDVIYARQNQTAADWRAELGEVLALRPDHLSLYQLTIEPGTVFARRAAVGKLPGLPQDDQIADMYLETGAILSDHGMPAYEVSNHAAPGAECRHNMIYWRAGDWLGVGPGAHGRFGQGKHRIGTASVRSPDAWLAQVECSQTGVSETDPSPGAGHAEEYLMTGLRLAEGLDRRRLSVLGLDIPDEALEHLCEERLLSISEQKIIPTDRGRALADGLAAYLAARSIPTRDIDSQS